jgi:hypothetical protein
MTVLKVEVWGSAYASVSYQNWGLGASLSNASQTILSAADQIITHTEYYPDRNLPGPTSTMQGTSDRVQVATSV